MGRPTHVRQALILWHGEILEARRIAGHGLRLWGEDIDLPPAGEVRVGPLCILVEPLDVPPPPRRYVVVGRGMLASALLHVAALVFVAMFATRLPPDPGALESDRLQAMRAYLSRTEQAPVTAAPADHVSSASADMTLGTLPRNVVPPLLEEPKSVRARTRAPGAGGSNGGVLMTDPAPRSDRQLNCVAFDSYWVSGMKEVHAPAGSDFKWVMELTDAEMRPMPNAPYRAFLPDGRTFHAGTTDGLGRVCFTGIDPNNRDVLLFFEKYGVAPVCATPKGEYPRDCADEEALAIVAHDPADAVHPVILFSSD